jgi:hypothetical protein
MIPIELIEVDGDNPPRRNDPNWARNCHLANSMAEVGQLMPIRVRWCPKKGKFKLIEGNRRYITSRHLLKWTEIWAIIDNRDENVLFMHTNEHVVQHNANDRLWSFLRHSGRTTPYMHTAYTNMLRVIGRPLAKRLASSGYTYATYKQAVVAAAFCGRPDDSEFISKVVRWLIDHKQTYALRTFLKALKPLSRAQLIWAIEKDKPLCC